MNVPIKKDGYTYAVHYTCLYKQSQWSYEEGRMRGEHGGQNETVEQVEVEVDDPARGRHASCNTRA